MQPKFAVTAVARGTVGMVKLVVGFEAEPEQPDIEDVQDNAAQAFYRAYGTEPAKPSVSVQELQHREAQAA